MVQAQPPSVGLQRESADARTLDWVSLPQLTRVICFAICRSLTAEVERTACDGRVCKDLVEILESNIVLASRVDE